MEDMFDVLIKAYKDIRRVRERIEAVKRVELDKDSYILLKKIKEEAKIILYGEKDGKQDQKETQKNET